MEIEWVLVFTTVGGTKERVSANFGRTDLHTLKNTGYVTLIQRHRDEFTCAPRQKAYEQYELHRRPLPTGEDYRIFVNYRHDDSSPYRGPLHEKLSSHFRRDLVFMAQPSIEPGALWLDAVEDAKRSCDVMIVLIGKQWVTVTDDHGRRRLDDPEDLLCWEIETALGRKTLVIPVLVGGARMPRKQDLPNSPRELAERQAHRLTDDHWVYDTDQLAKKLETALGHVQDLLRKVVRDEDGTQFYVHNSGERHFAKDDEDKTARFLRGPKGEISASAEGVEPYPLGDPMDRVLRCKLLYRDPGPHIYALLNGKTYYPGTNDLDYWGRNNPKEWRHVSEQEFQAYPSGD